MNKEGIKCLGDNGVCVPLKTVNVEEKIQLTEECEKIKVTSLEIIVTGEKIKVTSLEIIVTGTKLNPYFEIRYKEVGKENYNIGYSSYDLDKVFDWKEKCFEIELGTRCSDC